MSQSTSRADGPLTNRILNGRYQLEGRVGGGGMAVVYRARDMALGRIVAIKVLREQYGSDPKFLSRFVREAQSAANLGHPNIVNVYDVGQDGEVHYIVMELIIGETLRQYVDRNSGKLDADTTAEIGAQVCAALAAAHRAGIIHRDVKPQNVLISTEGVVKVTDFGIAKGLSDMSMTEAGATLGTVQYFSPEQARGERVSAPSDIYSVGVMLYEMLAGRLPFEADSMMGIAIKHIEELPVPLRQVEASVPRGLEAIVMRALEKNPANRFATAEEMEQSLRNYRNYAPRRNTGGQQRPATVGQRVAYEQRAPAVRNDSRLTPRSSAMYDVERSGPGWASWLIGFIVLALLGGGLIFALTVLPTLTNNTATPTPQPVAEPTITPVPATATPSTLPPVPNVVTLDYNAAIRLLSNVGYKIDVKQVPSGNVPFGQVISQNPSGFTANLPRGTIVTLVVSIGPSTIKLQDYKNTDANAAVDRLQKAGLKVTSNLVPGQPAGVVVNQKPGPGEVVPLGSEITLDVTNGQP